jgi:hypothetical protein
MQTEPVSPDRESLPPRRPVRVIKEGDTIVIVVNNDKTKAIIEQHLKPTKKIKLFKNNLLNAADLIGNTFDSFFEYSNDAKKFVLMKENPEPEPTYEGINIKFTFNIDRNR